MDTIPAIRTREEILFDIMQTTSRLYSIRDKDILLERILTEARQALNADAGSIYLIEGTQLVIHYAQNTTLQKRLKPGEKLPFSIFSFPISDETIAGAAVKTKQFINEPDVYAISPDKQYKFGTISDTITGYKTVSTLTMPLIAVSGDVLGVLQMINALDVHDRIRAFTSDDEMFLSHFAANAAATLMHASLTREMILRMVQMAELHDPRETGLHVHRVANYAVEIYDRWAFNHNIHRHEREEFRDALKIAAMLHDVGKIGISDSILKKPGKLTPEAIHGAVQSCFCRVIRLLIPCREILRCGTMKTGMEPVIPAMFRRRQAQYLNTTAHIPLHRALSVRKFRLAHVLPRLPMFTTHFPANEFIKRNGLKIRFWKR